MMGKYNGEKVLVIRRSLFDDLGEFQGYSKKVDQYLPAITNVENNFFVDRDNAEEDFSLKQIIPYTIFKKGDTYLHYRRAKSGGEARLHEKRSLGIGGHINPIDTNVSNLGMDTYLSGVEREIAEELNIEGQFTQEIIAVINDDSNDVGKVHLGVVHVFVLEENAQITSNEDSIADITFSTVNELEQKYHDSLESWSQICIEVLKSI